MGEIADMMLDGTLCECCGVVIISEGQEPPGFPGYCSPECAADRGVPFDDAGLIEPHDHSGVEKINCPDCGKRCRGEQGLADHHRAKHEPRPNGMAAE